MTKSINNYKDAKVLATRIAELTLEKKAEDVIIMDLRPLTSMTDYFVVCSGLTNTQITAIADHVYAELKKEKLLPLHVERTKNHEWVLSDYVDVVLHVFHPDKREFYSLERLWGDAEIIEIKDEKTVELENNK